MIVRELRKFFTSRTQERDRFLKGDRPTERNFSRLFDSVGFIRESSDRASLTDQGFVKLTADSAAQRGETPTTLEGGSESFSFVVQPQQLPNVIAGDQEVGSLEGIEGDEAIEVQNDDTAESTKRTFVVRLKQTFLDYLIKRLVPTDGMEGQILHRTGNNDEISVWADSPVDRSKVIDLTGEGVDYIDYIANGPFAGGILQLMNRYNTYFIKGNPDPNPGGYSLIGEFYQIRIDGAEPGFRLKVRFEEAVKYTNRAELFPGNIDLGEFGEEESGTGARILTLNPMDTATFISVLEDDELRWVLFEVNIAETFDRLLPESGNPGQVLTKLSDSDYDADWRDIPSEDQLTILPVPTNLPGPSGTSILVLPEGFNSFEIPTIPDTINGNIGFQEINLPNAQAGRQIKLIFRSAGILFIQPDSGMPFPGSTGTPNIDLNGFGIDFGNDVTLNPVGGDTITLIQTGTPTDQNWRVIDVSSPSGTIVNLLQRLEDLERAATFIGIRQEFILNRLEVLVTGPESPELIFGGTGSTGARPSQLMPFGDNDLIYTVEARVRDLRIQNISFPGSGGTGTLQSQLNDASLNIVLTNTSSSITPMSQSVTFTLEEDEIREISFNRTFEIDGNNPNFLVTITADVPQAEDRFNVISENASVEFVVLGARPRN